MSSAAQGRGSEGTKTFYRCHTCDFVARLYRMAMSQHVTVQLHAATLSHTNQTNMTDYHILANSLVLPAVLQNESVRSIEELRND